MRSTRLLYSVPFYILLMTLLCLARPAFMFQRVGEDVDSPGAIRAFGAGPSATVYSFGVMSIAAAILSFYIFCILDIFFQ
jgi:hypothetical protein